MVMAPPFTVALLLLLVRVEGIRRDGLMSAVLPDTEGNHLFLGGAGPFHDTTEPFENLGPPPRDVPPDFCRSCQEVSRKAENFLADPSLNEEANTLAAEICQILNSGLQTKCRKVVELHLHEGISFLQVIFLDNNLCNSSGFCPVDNNPFSSSTSLGNKDLPSLDPNPQSLKNVHEQLLKALGYRFPSRIEHSPLQVSESKSCDACHAATDQICKGLEEHEQQIKIMKSLLKTCEALIEYHVNKCTRWVFQYGPLVLANVHKFLSSEDLCHFIRMCQEPMQPKGETDHLYLSMEHSSPQLGNALAKIAL